MTKFTVLGPANAICGATFRSPQLRDCLPIQPTQPLFNHDERIDKILRVEFG